MREILITILRLYQRLVSPHLRCSCKFWPSCSEYAIISIKKYGVMKGMAKTTYRLLRCNPFSHGKIDLP